jgi:SAM-dependent methyltransferase
MAEAFPAGHGGKLSAPERLKALPQADVVRLLRLDGDETVVDYGAGTGVYTEAVAEALPRGLVIAVEALPELAEQLQATLGPRLLERVNVVVTGDNHVPVEDGCADRVVMVDVLHHLYDDPGALREVTRLLRPGGLFVVVDWGPADRPVGPPPGHVLGLETVRRIAQEMGLEEVEAHDQGDGLCCHVVLVARKPAP